MMSLKSPSGVMFIALIVSISFFLGGCAAGTTRPVRSNDAIAREILAAEAEGDLGPEAQTAQPRQSRHKIPIEINERVNAWVEFFTVRDRTRFHRFLKRGQVYREMVQRILKEHNVPRELYYLAMIESGYATKAVSHAQAVGVWQFIRGTGRRYGLRTDRYIDERRDPILATKAAARYLSDLHGMFGSWYLAMAGYNAGEGRILGAIKKGDTRDFWELADKGILPRETMNYIPKFLAAVIVGRNPAKFGFTDIEPDVTLPELERVRVQASHGGISAIAKASRVDDATLRRLNPHLKVDRIPASYGSYAIWIPKNSVASFRKNQFNAAARKVAYAPSNPIKTTRYRVRNGDTLEAISERFGVSVSALKRMNGLRRNRIYSGQSLKIATARI